MNIIIIVPIMIMCGRCDLNVEQAVLYSFPQGKPLAPSSVFGCCGSSYLEIDYYTQESFEREYDGSRFRHSVLHDTCRPDC